MNAIILCGGLSTRLGEITKTTPKILLDVKGKRVLDWQLEKLRALGVSEIVLAAGHLAEVLYQKIGLRYRGFDLTYAIEDKRLGTGGAIQHAWNYLEDQTKAVVILNGDILAGADLKDMSNFVRPLSDGNILGVSVPDASSYGTLKFNENYLVKTFKEKEGTQGSGVINGGIYIFNPAARAHFPTQDTFSIEYDVFPKMRSLYVYLSDRPWVDIGVPERLEWARKNWSDSLKH